MSASQVISVVLASRQTKQASRLLEPRYMIPAVVGGGAGAYWLNKKIRNDWSPTSGDKLESFVRRHPVAIGATLGGLATGGAGALALRKLLKRLHEQAPAQEAPQAPPISIQIGDQAFSQTPTPAEEPKLAGLKHASPGALMGLLRAYGHAGRSAAQLGARGIQGGARAVGRGARWAGQQGRKYTGMSQVEAEHAVRNHILQNPQSRQAYEALTAHMAQRGIKPRTGLGGVLMNPGGAIGRHFSAAGRVGWDLGQLADPKAVQQLLSGADPKIHQAVKHLQGLQIPVGGKPMSALEHLKQESGQGWLVPTLFAGSMAAPLVLSGDRKARIAEPNSPGARESMFQPAANAAGGWIGKNLSPTVGNWVQQHPGASAGLAGGGLAGLGFLGYQGLKGD